MLGGIHNLAGTTHSEKILPVGWRSIANCGLEIKSTISQQLHLTHSNSRKTQTEEHIMSGPQKYSRQDFLKIFPSLVEDIKQSATKYKVPENALEWLENVSCAIGCQHTI